MHQYWVSNTPHDILTSRTRPSVPAGRARAHKERSLVARPRSPPRPPRATRRTPSHARLRVHIGNAQEHGRTLSTCRARADERRVACAQTSCGQRSREQRGSRRAHRCARRARPALASQPAVPASCPCDCHSRTPAGPPKGTQAPFQCRPQNGRGTGHGTRSKYRHESQNWVAK